MASKDINISSCIDSKGKKSEKETDGTLKLAMFRVSSKHLEKQTCFLPRFQEMERKWWNRKRTTASSSMWVSIEE